MFNFKHKVSVEEADTKLDWRVWFHRRHGDRDESGPLDNNQVLIMTPLALRLSFEIILLFKNFLRESGRIGFWIIRNIDQLNE